MEEESHKDDESIRGTDVPGEAEVDAGPLEPSPEPRRRWGGYGGQERIGDFGERLRAYRSGDFSPGVPAPARRRPPLGRFGRDPSPQDPGTRDYTGRPTVWQPETDDVRAKPAQPPESHGQSDRAWLRPRPKDGKSAPET